VCPLDRADLPAGPGGDAADRPQALRVRVEGRLEVLEREGVVEDRRVRAALGAPGPRRGQPGQQRARRARAGAGEEGPAGRGRERGGGLAQRAVAVERAEVEAAQGDGSTR
jgi:hypothetical protein